MSSGGSLELPSGWDKERVNRSLEYHGEISYALTLERTVLESALIPVTAYILISAVECYRRQPEMLRAVAAAKRPQEIGAVGRTVGNQIDAVHLWSLANIFLTGRNVLASAGMIDWEEDLLRCGVMLEFWERAARAYHAGTALQAWDTGGVNRPYSAYVEEIVAGCDPVSDDRRSRIQRLNALLTSYLFLLYFDTRAGYQDTGPYVLPDGRVLLLRAFNKFGVSDFHWSAEVASDLPHSSVLAAFIIDGVRLRVTDWGTSLTEPEDYLPHVQSFGLFDTSGGALTPIGAEGADELAAAVKDAQKKCYRLIAGMENRQKIDAGAYVYFSFIRPFSDEAGCTGDLDWTVPRDSLDLYPILETIERAPDVVREGAYYPLIP